MHFIDRPDSNPSLVKNAVLVWRAGIVGGHSWRSDRFRTGCGGNLQGSLQNFDKDGSQQAQKDKKSLNHLSRSEKL